MDIEDHDFLLDGTLRLCLRDSLERIRNIKPASSVALSSIQHFIDKIFLCSDPYQELEKFSNSKISSLKTVLENSKYILKDALDKSRTNKVKNDYITTTDEIKEKLLQCVLFILSDPTTLLDIMHYIAQDPTLDANNQFGGSDSKLSYQFQNLMSKLENHNHNRIAKLTQDTPDLIKSHVRFIFESLGSYLKDFASNYSTSLTYLHSFLLTKHDIIQTLNSIVSIPEINSFTKILLETASSTGHPSSEIFKRLTYTFIDVFESVLSNPISKDILIKELKISRTWLSQTLPLPIAQTFPGSNSQHSNLSTYKNGTEDNHDLDYNSELLQRLKKILSDENHTKNTLFDSKETIWYKDKQILNGTPSPSKEPQNESFGHIESLASQFTNELRDMFNLLSKVLLNFKSKKQYFFNDTLNEILGHCHKIKGGADALGYTYLSQIAQVLKAAFELLKNSNAIPNTQILQLTQFLTKKILELDWKVNNFKDDAEFSKSFVENAQEIMNVAITLTQPNNIEKDYSIPGKHETLNLTQDLNKISPYALFNPIQNKKSQDEKQAQNKNHNRCEANSTGSFFEEATFMLSLDLVNNLFKMKLTNISESFQSFHKYVEDVARSQKKQVRNAIIHGIEVPSIRKDRKKAEIGKIMLKASLKSSFLEIEISDDGEGLDFEKIKYNAIALNLISHSEAKSISENQLIELIFKKEFKNVKHTPFVNEGETGLKNVKRSIEKINGTLSLKTNRGEGTSLTLKIPLLHSTVHVALVTIKDFKYAIPIAYVEDVITLSELAFETMLTTRTVIVKGNTLDVVSLAGLVELKNYYPQRSYSCLIIIKVQNQSVALLVDKMVGKEEAVLTQNSFLVNNQKGIIGTTSILGNEPIPILDVQALFQKTTDLNLPFVEKQHIKLQDYSLSINQTSKQPEQTKSYTLIHFDESLIIRNHIKMLLSDSDYNVVSSNSITNATELVDRKKIHFDAILTDLEILNRKSEFEFLDKLTQNSDRKIPIIVLSARSMKLYGEAAKQRGASYFLEKPIERQKLIAALEHALKGRLDTRKN
ncbi:hypothetical protein CHS0354_023724 [Potamilus streckersoni]|uniref:histidine kinase n=1 Tax=Potamilus streckersoni TaxID=2493646 RepID=A0AAE0RZ50_9BIVA|nr:hypothetical protein CHS0354_023724 [Potamilus streckersoni]